MSRIRYSPLVTPFTRSSKVTMEEYIQSFTACNKLLPSPFIINGKEILL